LFALYDPERWVLQDIPKNQKICNIAFIYLRFCNNL
jgi:hypothetical protein